MTYDKGAGYLFGHGLWTVSQFWRRIPSRSAPNRMDVVTNGRKLSPGIDERREGQRFDHC